MARIRSVKPEMWHDEALGGVTVHARLLFVGLITQADDEGRLRGNPSLLAGQVFPYDEVSGRKVEKWLEELESRGLIVRYAVNAERFVALTSWDKHQRINRKTASALPSPPAEDVSAHDTLTEPSVNPQGASSEDSRPRARAQDQGEDQGSRKGSSSANAEPVAPPRDEAGQDIEKVFAAWCESTGRGGRTVLDEKRRRIIRQARKLYPIEDLVDAVRGWKHSPYHRGENEKRTIYNDLGLLLRDAEHIEKFRDLERGAGTHRTDVMSIWRAEQARKARTGAAA